VVAAHPNDLQAEVLAVQSTVGTSPVISVLNASTRINSATSFNSSPISTSFSTVKERISNVERGLMGVGYVPAIDGGSVKTISASGSTVTDTFSSIPGGYRKLVLELEITAFSTGGAVTVTLNGVTSNYSVSRLVYTASTEDSEVQPSTSASGLSLGTSTALGNIYVVEVPNYAANRAYKVFRGLGPTLSLTGSVATGTVTSLTVSVAGTQTVQATLYVVK
jgi:hypothetical protein